MALVDGLISYWDLDDLTDKHGSNDLTNNGGVTFVTDGSDTVADFESASEQSLSRAHASVSGFSGLTAMTIAGFQKIEKLPNTSSDKQSWGLLSKFNSAFSGRGWLVRANDFDNDLECTVSGDSSFSNYLNTRTNSPLWASGDVGNWISIIVTIDTSTDTIVVYKNNVAVAETESNAGNPSVIYDQDTPLYIGVGNNSTTERKCLMGAWSMLPLGTECLIALSVLIITTAVTVKRTLILQLHLVRQKLNLLQA